ncbi:MAG: hypothetical protein AB7F35_00755 [Acetobacteraceae bacterium]
MAAISDIEAALPKDEAAERRRAKDRLRKQEERLRKSAESADSIDITDAASPLDAPLSSPSTPSPTNPPLIPPAPAECDDEFERFWKLYPGYRRKNKPGAFSQWKVAKRKADPPTIIGGLMAYLDSRDAKEGFAPYPAKWLKQEQWADDHTQPIPGKTQNVPKTHLQHTGFSETDYRDGADKLGFDIAN